MEELRSWGRVVVGLNLIWMKIKKEEKKKECYDIIINN